MKVARIDLQPPLEGLREARRKARESDQVVDEVVTTGRVENEMTARADRGEQVVKDFARIGEVLEDLSQVDALHAGGQQRRKSQIADEESRCPGRLHASTP